jgi:hypothetical protein
MKTAKEIAKWAYDGGRNNRLYTYEEAINRIEQKIEDYANSKVENLALSDVSQQRELLVCNDNELDCPYDFTSRCTMGRCNCKPKAN